MALMKIVGLNLVAPHSFLRSRNMEVTNVSELGEKDTPQNVGVVI